MSGEKSSSEFEHRVATSWATFGVTVILGLVLGLQVSLVELLLGFGGSNARRIDLATLIGGICINSVEVEDVLWLGVLVLGVVEEVDRGSVEG